MRQAALSPSSRSRAAKCMYTAALDSGVMAGTPTLSNVLASPRVAFPGSILSDSSSVSSVQSTPRRNCHLAAQSTKTHCGTPSCTILPSSPSSPCPRSTCFIPMFSAHSRVMSDINERTIPQYTARSRVPKYCSYDSLFFNSQSYENKKDFTESKCYNVIPTMDANDSVSACSFSDPFPKANTTPSCVELTGVELTRAAGVDLLSPSSIKQGINETDVKFDSWNDRKTGGEECRNSTYEGNIVPPEVVAPLQQKPLGDLSNNTTVTQSPQYTGKYHPIPTANSVVTNLPLPPSDFGFFYRACAWAPHPDKVASGGEDSFMCTDSALGVADGVGWWASNQVRKKELAEIRAHQIQKERKMKREQKKDVKPTEVKFEVKTRQTLSGGSMIFDDAHAKTMSDSQQYSELFMRAAFDFVEEEYLGQGQVPVTDMVKYAYKTVHEDHLGEKDATNDSLSQEDDDTVTTKEVGGSATVLFATIVYDVLEVYTLGDCKLMLIRNGKVTFQSEDQLHDLNFPFQLGVGSKDRPEDGIVSRVKVRPGDLVLLGSDGIFDNVFDRDIIKILKDIVATDDEFIVRGLHNIDNNKRYEPLALSADDFTYRRILHEELRSTSSRLRSGVLGQSLLNKASQRILQLAKNVASDPRADTPFANKCLESGAYYEGGKQDDMTLVMAMITQSMIAEGIRFGENDTGAVLPPFYKNWP